MAPSSPSITRPAAQKGAVHLAEARAGPLAGPEDVWTTRYEALRQQALEGASAAGTWGQTLLVRQGLVAWIRAWGPEHADSAGERRRTIAGRTEPPEVPQDHRRQMVVILADMILAARPATEGYR